MKCRNPFTANVTKNEKLPVLFFIYGGGYAEGSGNDNFYGPDFFVENHVILVTFNYRVSIFGFLSLDLPEYSGNMGLKDQQLALKWIHKNIGHFNGDNENIMVFGESSGECFRISIKSVMQNIKIKYLKNRWNIDSFSYFIIGITKIFSQCNSNERFCIWYLGNVGEKRSSGYR